MFSCHAQKESAAAADGGAGNVPMPQQYAARRIPGEERRRVGFASLGLPLLIPDPSPSFHLTPFSELEKGVREGSASELEKGVPAFVAAASAAAEAVVPAVAVVAISFAAAVLFWPAQRHLHLRPGGAAADSAAVPLLLRRRRPEAAAGLPVGMAAVAAAVVAVAASEVCQAWLRRRRRILGFRKHRRLTRASQYDLRKLDFF